MHPQSLQGVTANRWQLQFLAHKLQSRGQVIYSARHLLQLVMHCLRFRILHAVSHHHHRSQHTICPPRGFNMASYLSPRGLLLQLQRAFQGLGPFTQLPKQLLIVCFDGHATLPDCVSGKRYNPPTTPAPTHSGESQQFPTGTHKNSSHTLFFRMSRKRFSTSTRY